MLAKRVKMIEGGKLIIPAAMRRALGLERGDTVLLDINQGELRVRSLAKAVERAQAIVGRHTADGTSLVDDLIADRRDEARRE